MAIRERIPVLAGKVIKSAEKRVHQSGDKYTTLMLIIFEDGTSMELTSCGFSDGTNGMAFDYYEK